MPGSFPRKSLRKGFFPVSGKRTKFGKEDSREREEADLASIDLVDCREVGGAWLCKHAFEKAGMLQSLTSMGFNESEAVMAMILIAAKMLHSSSERETERWLNNNTELSPLFGIEQQSITRYQLY